jgi:hypothetical protein
MSFSEIIVATGMTLKITREELSAYPVVMILPSPRIAHFRAAEYLEFH